MSRLDGMSESVPKKRRLKIDTGAGVDLVCRVAVLVPADGTIADACAAAEAIGSTSRSSKTLDICPTKCVPARSPSCQQQRQHARMSDRGK
jgi:hypothetical protein